jgi:hypothetical protein
MEQEVLNKEYLILIEKLKNINKSLEETNKEIAILCEHLEDNFLINKKIIEKDNINKIDKSLTEITNEIQNIIIPKINKKIIN